LIIQELVTKLGFNVDTKSIAHYEKSFHSLRNTILGVAGAVAGVIGTGVAFARSAANYGDEIGESAQKIGISTDALQKFRYTAKLSGLSAEGLGTGVKFLSKNLIAAQEGSKEATESFAKIGIDPKKVKSSEELLLSMSGKFSQMKDGAGKTALAIKLFGRSGIEMIPMLNKGPEALEKNWKMLEKLGGVMGKDVIAAGDKFMDSWDTMTTAIWAFKNVVGAELMPVVQKFIDRLIEWYGANREIINQKIHTFLEKLSNILMKLPDNLDMVATGFKRVGEAIVVLYAAEKMAGLLQLASAIGLIGGKAAGTEGALTKLGANLRGGLFAIGLFFAVDIVRQLYENWDVFMRGMKSLKFPALEMLLSYLKWISGYSIIKKLFGEGGTVANPTVFTDEAGNEFSNATDVFTSKGTVRQYENPLGNLAGATPLTAPAMVAGGKTNNVQVKYENKIEINAGNVSDPETLSQMVKDKIQENNDILTQDLTRVYEAGVY